MIEIAKLNVNTLSGVKSWLDSNEIPLEKVVKIFATYVENVYNETIIKDVVFSGPNDASGDSSLIGRVWDPNDLVWMDSDTFLINLTNAKYWVVYEEEESGYVPNSRKIAGISLSGDISAQTITDALILANNNEIDNLF